MENFQTVYILMSKELQNKKKLKLLAVLQNVQLIQFYSYIQTLT